MKKALIAGLLGVSLAFPSLPLWAKVPLGTKPEMVKRMRLVNAVAQGEPAALAKRRVTVRRADGVHITVKVDEAVKGIEDLKAGDRVKIRYYESTSYQLVKVDPKETKKEKTVKVSESLPAGGGNTQQ